MRCAGSDWADQHQESVVMNGQGRRVGATRVAHSVAGLDALVAFLRDASGDGDEIACIVETTNGLLVSALLDAKRAGHPVVLLAIGQEPPKEVPDELQMYWLGGHDKWRELVILDFTDSPPKS